MFKWTLKDLCEVIDKTINNKFDFIIFIEGKRGAGKSTLGYKASHGITPKFVPERDLVYKRDDVIKGLANKTKGIIFGDEMINVAYNRDFYEQDQKILLKALNMYRDSCNVFIGCVPRFVDLDKQIQKLCKMRIQVVRRGLAILHKQVPSIYKDDPWDIKTNMKIEAKWNQNGIIKPIYSQLTTYAGHLYFGDLSPRQRERYERIKKERRHKVYGNYEDMDKTVDDVFYHNLVKRLKGGKITKEMFQEICLVAGKKYKSVQVRVNQILKDSGERKTYKDFISLNKIKSSEGVGFNFG